MEAPKLLAVKCRIKIVAKYILFFENFSMGALKLLAVKSRKKDCAESIGVLKILAATKPIREGETCRSIPGNYYKSEYNHRDSQNMIL